MSILIDRLIFDHTKTQVNKKWYCAKPESLLDVKTILNRVKDSFRVLRGTSFAVHFAEDSEQVNTNEIIKCNEAK